MPSRFSVVASSCHDCPDHAAFIRFVVQTSSKQCGDAGAIWMQRSALSKSSSSPSLTQLSWERSSRSNGLLGSVRSCSGGWTTMTNGSSRSTTSLRKNMNKVCSTPAASQFESPNVQQGMLQTVAAQALEREVFAFTASKILQAGAQGTGPHRVRCFEDRMLVAQRFGNITLPFKQITHAELDGRSCSLKLHLGMTGMLCDATVQQYPPGLLKIELQSAADLAMLRQAVWPTLMRYLLKPGGNKASFGHSRGPSLVWSHA